MVFCGLVLARGSSKSIAHKNIKTLVNKPLIGWVLEPMKSSPVFNEIWVSTDDEEIAKIAISYEVKVHRRSQQNASDFATSLSAIQEFLNYNKSAERICLVQCTSPCLWPSFLETAHNLMIAEEYESVFSVYRSHSLRWSLDLNPLNFDPKARPRRQDWNGEYVESGHFYCFTRELVEREGRIQGRKCGVVEIPNQFCVEIDNMFDWNLAENLVKQMISY